MPSLVSQGSSIVSGTLGTLPPRDPSTWTLEHAQAAVWAEYPVQYDATAAASVRDYVQGMHYQDAKPWMGSGYNTDGTLADGSKTIIARQLTPVPEMFACLERRVDGACGIQAAISIRPSEPAGGENEKGEKQPSDQQQREAQEWVSDLSAWIDERRAWGGKDLRKPTGVRGMVAQASYSQSGAACLRVFYNPASLTQSVEVREGDGVRTEQRIPRQPDRRSALRHVRIVAPPPERCAVYTDPDTHEKTGVFLFTDPATQQEGAEIWFARDGKTVLRMLEAGKQAEPERIYPWGGWLPILQGEIGCLVTDAVRRLQGALDFGGTALVRLLQSQAWGQRTEINAEEDGFWSTTAPAGVTNPRTKVTDGITEYFNPLPAGIGPDLIRMLRGIEHTTGANDQGETLGLTTPSVHYHDPSDPMALINGIDAITMIMRHACHQGHIRSGLLGSTAESSGEAYEQARAAFGSDIDGVGEEVDAVWAPTLTVATIMADWLTANDNPAEFAEQWIVGSQSHPNPGDPSPDSQRATREMVESGLLSPEEGIARLNVQDVGAEITRIATSRHPVLLEKRAAALKNLIDSGCDPIAAAMELGWTEEAATRLLRSDGTTGVEQ